MKNSNLSGVPVMLILLVLVAVILYLTALPEQPLWWVIVAGVAVVGCAWGSIADSLAKSKQLRRDRAHR
ncbi:hypothetical protein GCM10027591_04970 [Zhihengliuella somnathii]